MAEVEAALHRQRAGEGDPQWEAVGLSPPDAPILTNTHSDCPRVFLSRLVSKGEDFEWLKAPSRVTLELRFIPHFRLTIIQYLSSPA